MPLQKYVTTTKLQKLQKQLYFNYPMFFILTKTPEVEWPMERLLATAQPERWETTETEEDVQNSDSDHPEVNNNR